jgi:hypothetical protein
MSLKRWRWDPPRSSAARCVAFTRCTQRDRADCGLSVNAAGAELLMRYDRDAGCQLDAPSGVGVWRGLALQPSPRKAVGPVARPS